MTDTLPAEAVEAASDAAARSVDTPEFNSASTDGLEIMVRAALLAALPHLARRADDHYFAVDYTGCIHEAPDRETAIKWAEDFARTANGGAIGSERPEVATKISQMIEASKVRVAAMTPAEREEELDSRWRGPYKSAAEALNETRRACADLIGADPETWPSHGNAPLAITASLALALRAAVPSEQEPVAWVFELAQARHQRTGEWVHFGPPQLSFTKPNVPDGSIRNLCPLVRPAPAAGVRVKALEWVHSSWADGTLSRAESVFGTYRVWTNPETGKWFWRLSDAPLGREPSGMADNEPAAKAAAQADYEGRILSAIDTGEPK